MNGYTSVPCSFPTRYEGGAHAAAGSLQSRTWKAMIVFQRRGQLSSKAQVGPEGPVPGSLDDERKEFGAVLAALPKASRQARLISYIGEKYFQGETDKLHEYNIATEVFDRSRTSFNPGEDAIVRVEAHRLRKRLKEYYENEGKNNLLQISIPPGTYVPVFTRRCAAPAESANSKSEAISSPPARKPRSLIYAVAAVALVLAGVAIYAAIAGHSSRRAGVGAANVVAPKEPSAHAAGEAQVPLRILAGYSGKPQIDSAGETWQPDRYFNLGGTWDRTGDLITRTSDPMLFEHWRNGEFSYDIPLRPGDYELHLYFIAVDPAPSSPSTFSVSINGNLVLTGFDVNSDAMGPEIADERIFRDVSPASDGILHLGFNSERGNAILNAMEILPGTPGRQLPIRLVTQPTSFTDHNGNFWRPDDYYLDGYSSMKRTQIAGTPDPDLFAEERYGHFSYAIPVDPRDLYTVVLHFAEFYFGPNASGVGGAGSRIFRVRCNGKVLLDNFDIYKEAGSLHAVTKTFYHLKASAQGKLNITFEPIVNNATVSGIEVLDESQ